ncbi:MAG: hypothetical protein WC755_06535 [Candidatus Woesearchaeota archaeon]|jgi:hypothetical protein
MVITKIKNFFKKNVKVDIVDDSIPLHVKEIKPFLEKELKEKIKEINEVVNVSYEYLDKNIVELKEELKKLNKTNSKSLQPLSQLLSEIKIPITDNYFEALVFSTVTIKKWNLMLFSIKKEKRTELVQKIMNIIYEILKSLKQIIDNSNLTYYDVILEEIDSNSTIISKPLIEIQIYKLTKKKVTVYD